MIKIGTEFHSPEAEGGSNFCLTLPEFCAIIFKTPFPDCGAAFSSHSGQINEKTVFTVHQSLDL